ncbi:MAG: tetratricopeptide repeat protein, partial [Candidatus Poseidoniaceae archaeon]
PEGYDEPELLAFVCEWLDPWHGTVDEDDLWDWENNSTIDHLNEKMRMLRYWAPSYSKEATQHEDRIALISAISNVATLRMQRKHEEALELALDTVKQDPLGVRPRIAAALCLLDRGDWHQALSIYKELRESDVNDPRVKALSVILGHEADAEDIEVSLVLEKGKSLRRWLDDAPVNPVAGLATKGGIDEAINANVMIVSHEAVRRGMTPRYSISMVQKIVQFFLLPMIYIVTGIGLDSVYGPVEGAVAAGTLFVLQIGLYRFNRQQRKQIKHRDQRSLVEYAKMMKRSKVKPSRDNIPVGTHLLLSGILVTVNGVVLDIGLPGWLTERLPKDSDKTIRSRLKRNAMSISKNRPGKLSILSSGWWLKRPKEEDSDTPALERLVGPVAYRGRQTMVQRKTTSLNRSTSLGPSRTRVSDMNLSNRNVPTHTIASERSTYSGPRRPGKR